MTKFFQLKPLMLASTIISIFLIGIFSQGLSLKVNAEIYHEKQDINYKGGVDIHVSPHRR